MLALLFFHFFNVLPFAKTADGPPEVLPAAYVQSVHDLRFPESRTASLDALEEFVTQQLVRCAAKKEKGRTAAEAESVQRSAQGILTRTIPAIINLTVNCPFPAIREKCSDLVARIREQGAVPLAAHTTTCPSSYIPFAEVC